MDEFRSRLANGRSLSLLALPKIFLTRTDFVGVGGRSKRSAAPWPSLTSPSMLRILPLRAWLDLSLKKLTTFSFVLLVESSSDLVVELNSVSGADEKKNRRWLWRLWLPLPEDGG